MNRRRVSISPRGISPHGFFNDLSVFTIVGKDYAVPSSEYLLDLGLGGGKCAIAVLETEAVGFASDWIFGDTWIRTYCNIHDVGQDRIGFAKAHHSEI